MLEYTKSLSHARDTLQYENEKFASYMTQRELLWVSVEKEPQCCDVGGFEAVDGDNGR